MKILCTSQIGSSTVLGQTMRVIAIAKALQRQGAQVKYLAGGKLIPVVQSHGIEVIPLPPMPEVEFFPSSEQMKDPLYQEKMASKMADCLQLSQNSEKEAIAADRPDLMLCGSPLSTLTAKEAGIPAVLTMLQPHGKKTCEYFRQKMQDRRNLNRLLAGKVGDGDFQPSFFQAPESIGLIFLEGMPEINGDVDSEEIGMLWAPEDVFQELKTKFRFTGPLLTERPENLPGQEELKLRYSGASNQSLVYVTIGGGTALIGEAFLRLVLDMFRSLPEVKGVVSTGLAVEGEKIAGAPLPDNVILRQFVPGTELIKASDVTVFHGGSSTLMTCIACGRPAVVIPSMAEQEDNGMVLARRGAGVVLDKQDLTPEILAKAVRTVLNDGSFGHQAEELQKLGEKYGGADGAAVMIEKMVEERRLVHAGTDFSGR